MVGVGVVAMVCNSPNNTASAVSSIITYPTLAYASIACTTALWVANPMDSAVCGMSKETRRGSVIYYCILSGTMGSLTIISAKAVSAALIHSITTGEKEEFTDANVCWLTYLLIISLISSTTLQLSFMSTALQTFRAGAVISTHHLVLTALAVVAGGNVFQERFAEPGEPKLSLYAFGLLLTIAGVFKTSSSDDGGEWVLPVYNCSRVEGGGC